MSESVGRMGSTEYNGGVSPPEGRSPDRTTPSGPDYLSFSRLTTYESCPKKFQLLYLDRFPAEPQGSFIAGGLLHQIIAEIEQKAGGLMSPPPSVEMLAEEWQSRFTDAVMDAGGPQAIRWAGRKTKAFPQGEDYGWWMENGVTMLNRWVNLRAADGALGNRIDPKSIETEVGFVLRSTGRYIKGYIDAMVVVSSDGEARIRDYKTGQVGRSDPFQLASYSVAIQRSRELSITHGEFVYLRSDVPEKQIVGIDLSRYIEFVETAYGELEQALHMSQESGVWPVKRTSFCVSCSVKAGCWWGRTLLDEES